jgi:hypothetical protein
MYKRTINSCRIKEKEKNLPAAYAPSAQRLGATRDGIEVAQKYQIHPQTLCPWKKASGTEPG